MTRRHNVPVTVTPTLVLASGSPRRHQMLTDAGYALEVIPSDIEEIERAGEGPRQMAVRLAMEKAREVAGRVGRDRVVLGVDTVVAVDDRILGKPADVAGAVEMLSAAVRPHPPGLFGIRPRRAGAANTPASRNPG